MQAKKQISAAARQLLRCPTCHHDLAYSEVQLSCVNAECSTRYPLQDGIPILIAEQASVFSISDFTSHRNTYFSNLQESKLKKFLRSLRPTISNNVKGRANYLKFKDILLAGSAAPRVLVLGGSILGDGMEPLADSPAIELIETDISFGPRTMMICDAHDIPFADETFDGVIVQAVLEHVVDPHRCCDEIYRVLKKHGVVYAETPFMQQVHGGRYDFTRFTYLGHRRLFRHFEELDSGAVCGPGMALAWSYKYFLFSFTTFKPLRKILGLFAHMTSFYLKYFDHYLVDKPAALDAASGFYFVGRKSEQVLSDRELLKLYKGGVG